jgi:hypothetical protein
MTAPIMTSPPPLSVCQGVGGVGRAMLQAPPTHVMLPYMLDTFEAFGLFLEVLFEFLYTTIKQVR